LNAIKTSIGCWCLSVPYSLDRTKSILHAMAVV
jgi:hypothetical protein